VAVETRVYRDDRNLSNAGDEEDNRPGELRLTTRSWQVISIPDNVRLKRSGGSLIRLTRNKFVQTAINVYRPRKRDEMHCHPGSEHIFMVWQGELTVRGINEGEEMTLKPGDLVHIKAGHYYQLCNDTDEVAVLYQVASVPAKRSPIGRRSFRRAGYLMAEDINDRGADQGPVTG
jgi:mannose-6-phosphate isomerase-like protein (cupin superfamily)